MAPKDILTKEFLTEHYINQRKSYTTICRETGIKSTTSVMQACKRHGLHRSSLHNSKDVLTKEFLEEYYVRQNLSLRDVAEKAGFKRKDVVTKALERHGIAKREHTLSRKMIDGIANRQSHHTIKGRYFHSLVYDAQRRNIEFLISIDDAWKVFENQNCKCALSGIDLYFPKTGERAILQTASLDRICSDSPYIKGNIQWVHKDINKMKMDLSQDKFIELCKIIADWN